MLINGLAFPHHLADGQSFRQNSLLVQQDKPRRNCQVIFVLQTASRVRCSLTPGFNPVFAPPYHQKLFHFNSFHRPEPRLLNNHSSRLLHLNNLVTQLLRFTAQAAQHSFLGLDVLNGHVDR